MRTGGPRGGGGGPAGARRAPRGATRPRRGCPAPGGSRGGAARRRAHGGGRGRTLADGAACRGSRLGMDTAGVATDRGGAPAAGRRGGRGAQCTGPAAHDVPPPATCIRGGRAERAFGQRAPDRARSAGGTKCRAARRVPAGCGSRRLECARAACLARVAGGLMKSFTWVLMLATTLPLVAQEPADTAPAPSNGAEAQQLRKQIRQRWNEQVRTTLGLSY